MQTKRSSVWYAAAVAIGAVFAAMGIEAAPTCPPVAGTCTTATPCKCVSPSYTVELVCRTVTLGTATTQTTTDYQYKVSGSQSSINKIIEGQMVIPRPVSVIAVDPAGPDIVQGGSVTGVNTYCQEDKNSGINKGNCDGFLVHLAPISPTSGAVVMDIVSGQRVADGLVTMNLVGGQGSSELCLGVDPATNLVLNTRTGIVGPGDIGDPFQPKFTAQDAAVAGGKCVAHLVFDKHGNVNNVTTDPPCIVGSPGQPGSQFTGPEIITGGVPLRKNTGPHGLTFGNGTTTCSGPGIPSPAKCVCTALPCP